MGPKAWRSACGALRKGRVSAPPLEFVHLDSLGGPQLITALSPGRGYGEAGREGLFSWCETSGSLNRCTVPLSRKRGEGCGQLIFRDQT